MVLCGSRFFLKFGKFLIYLFLVNYIISNKILFFFFCKLLYFSFNLFFGIKFFIIDEIGWIFVFFLRENSIGVGDLGLICSIIFCRDLAGFDFFVLLY